MELKIKTHHALPCRTEVFTINGKSAEQNDFGNTYSRTSQRLNQEAHRKRIVFFR